MSGLRGLADDLRQLEDQLVLCMRCGLCQASCPLYSTTGRETDVARGKLALLDGMMDQLLADPKGAADHVRRCLLCGSCAQTCPSGVPVVDIFIKARAILAQFEGLSFAKRVVLRGLLARPALFDRLVAWVSRMQWVVTKPVDQGTGDASRFRAPIIGSRYAPALASTPFQHQAEELSGRGETVAFFVGCVIDKVYPQVGHAALAALRHHDANVLVPKGQACCGIPALSAGDEKAFLELLRHNLRIFGERRFDHLVTACATCTATIKEMWPRMAERLPAAEAAACVELAKRTVDIHQLLVDRYGVKAREVQSATTAVTYHDPCHLRKTLGVVDQPRALIRTNPACELREMAGAADCCGCGGTFNLAHYDMSMAIGQRKLAAIKETDASVVATGCPACMLQLTDLISRDGAGVRVAHVLEIYARSIGFDEDNTEDVPELG